MLAEPDGRLRSPSRAAVACLGAVAAFLVGGVAQAVAWRWGVDWLTAVSNSQFLWVFLCFLVAWGWSRGDLAAGAAAGAVTGFVLIASYYVAQWLFDSRDAAVSQLTTSHGLAWVASSVFGGAGIGLLGALAGTPPSQPRRKAFGLVAVAALVALGPLGWLLLGQGYYPEAGRWVAAAVFLGVGTALVRYAVRRCGPRETLWAAWRAVPLAVGLLATLLLLQVDGVLYLTF